jgi:DUF2993 family protein
MREAMLVLSALIAVAVLLVAADRMLRRFTERRVADRIAGSYGLTGQLSVVLPGFPFLTQVVAGHYHEVHVVLTSVTRAGVQFQQLYARLRGVRAPLSRLIGGAPATVTAADATATALVPFGAMARRLPAGLTLMAPDGKLRLLGSIGYQGFQLPVSAGVSLRVTPEAIEFSPCDISIGGAVSVPAGMLGSRLAFVLPMGDLPLQLKVTDVRVTQAGFEVSAAASGVAFGAGTRS